MARPAETYRAARKNAAREANRPMAKFTVSKEGVRASVIQLPPPSYMPHFCKKPRLKWGTFQVGPKPDPANDVMVPYTELRKQPKVYRKNSIAGAA